MQQSRGLDPSGSRPLSPVQQFTLMVEEEKWGEEVAGEPSEEDLKVTHSQQHPQPLSTPHTHTLPPTLLHTHPVPSPQYAEILVLCDKGSVPALSCPHVRWSDGEGSLTSEAAWPAAQA